MAEGDQRLLQQLEFVLEIDRLKGVLRRSQLTDASRRENSAEHSWHLVIMAMLLAEHSDEPVDLLRVVQMLAVHDLVEIDAGDTYCYDEVANLDKAEREEAAAERIFGLLPADQRQSLYELWQEFEQRESAESRFAAALDRMQPVLLNYHSGGRAWSENAISRRQAMERNGPIEEGSAALWRQAFRRIDDAVERGYLKP